MPGNDELTVARLRDTRDKISAFGLLPPWFGNVLPEGALRNLVETQMRSGAVGDFDIIKRLGSNLPGAVIVQGEAHEANRADEIAAAPDASNAIPKLKFSLAGVQLKFSAMRDGGRLTLPAQGAAGRAIVKFPHDRYPLLPEIEFSSMKLAEAAGVRVAQCELFPSDAAADIPARLRPGAHVLVLTRFDRTETGGRIHIEDFNQVMGAVGDQKYLRANEELVVKAVGRFAREGVAAVEEAIRRIVVNILIGNTDAHLKNWSFIFPEGNQIDLAPAYDIVSVVLIDDDQTMALKLRGTKDPFAITTERFEGFAKFVGLTDRRMRRLVNATVERASDVWPEILKGLPLSSDQTRLLAARWIRLPLTQGRAAPFKSREDLAPRRRELDTSARRSGEDSQQGRPRRPAPKPRARARRARRRRASPRTGD